MIGDTPFARMEILFGSDNMQRLSQCRVAVFGVGGVGGHCAEALARCGIGCFLLVDRDSVSLSNINRQAVALHSTIGRKKVEVMRDRILDINPAAHVETIAAFYGPKETLGIWDNPPDIIVDAIDTVAAKVDLAYRAQQMGIACVSCMGAGNKLDPTRFEVSDLYDTTVCPLCRAVRKAARNIGVKSLRVVYSKEPPAAQVVSFPSGESGRPVPGSVAFVTASAGLILANEAIRLLLLKCEHFPNN